MLIKLLDWYFVFVLYSVVADNNRRILIICICTETIFRNRLEIDKTSNSILEISFVYLYNFYIRKTLVVCILRLTYLKRPYAMN